MGRSTPNTASITMATSNSPIPSLKCRSSALKSTRLSVHQKPANKKPSRMLQTGRAWRAALSRCTRLPRPLKQALDAPLFESPFLQTCALVIRKHLAPAKPLPLTPAPGRKLRLRPTEEKTTRELLLHGEAPPHL